MSDHARRKEGHRRAAIFAQLKRDEKVDKVREIYRDYADLLRSSALAGRTAQDSGGDDGDAGARPPT